MKIQSIHTRMLQIAGLMAVPALLASVGCLAQPTPKQSLLALSKTDHTLAIVDPATGKVIAKMPVGADPHEVIASSDGKTAYVSIYGGGSFHEINVIDLVGQKALSTVDTRPLMGPHGLDFMGGKVWFSAEGSKAFGTYDPATNKVDWAMGTGQDRTHMIYVMKGEKTIYTTNMGSGTVSIITDSLMQPGGNAPPGARAQHAWIQTLVPVSRGSEGLDVTPDGKELWTAASEDGIISIIDLSSKKVIEKLDAKVFGANRIKITPDGKLALITSLRNGDLVIYDVQTRKEKKKVAMGHGAAGIQMDPNGGRAFVACTPDNYIVVIDLKTLEIVSRIDVGGGPDGMAWATQP